MARFIETFIYGRFDAITCITPEVESCLCSFLRLKSLSNSCVVYNGVDTQNFNKQKISRGDGGCNIAMIGSLTDKKDQETIIRALALLDESYILHLAGGGERREYLADLASELGVDKRVEFHGLINDIPNFLARMDIYVQSSKFEGFGLAAVEGMAADLPVLCSDVPGLAELTESKEGLFKQGDFEQLASCIVKVSKDPSYKKTLLELGKATSNKYSLVAMNKSLCSVYEEVV
jgi:glycosyltransferase involved in cell wall biosynthesis